MQNIKRENANAQQKLQKCNVTENEINKVLIFKDLL